MSFSKQELIIIILIVVYNNGTNGNSMNIMLNSNDNTNDI